MTFLANYKRLSSHNHSFLSIGLDSDIKKLPVRFQNLTKPQFEFNKWIINLTCDLVCAYKPNSAFYEARGYRGVRELKMTCDYLRLNYPEIPIILDAKRGDVGSSNIGYMEYAFDYLGAHAVTISPYLGKETFEPLFKTYKNKGFFVLCRTTNPGSFEFQDVRIKNKHLWELVAKNVSEKWNKYGNCMLVVGATFPRELKRVRKIARDMIILVPGIGHQGGDMEEVLKNGLDSQGKGLIINASRSIIFSKDPRKEAEKILNIMKTYTLCSSR